MRRDQSTAWHRSSIYVVPLALMLLASPALAQWPEILDALPAGANALAVVDVQALRDQAAKGKTDTQGAQAVIRDLGAELSEDVRRLAIAALVDYGSMEPMWEMSVAELARPISAREISLLEQGYVDKLEGRDVVWSPRSTYFVPLTPTRLAAAKPANRQLLARWLQNLSSGIRVGLPPYLRSIADTDTKQAAIVLALDFHDAVSARPARERLKTLDAVQQGDANIEEIANLLGGLEGVVFTVRLEKGLRGTIRVEFDRSPKVLAKVGKPMLLEILGRRGAYVEDLETWKPSVIGNSFVLQGSISASALRRALSFLTTPSTVGSLGREAIATSQSESQSDVQRKAGASKRYFDAVTKTVADVRTFKWTTTGQAAMWNDRMARKIDDLPLLNVDEDLLNYGNGVSNLLRGAGTTIRQANIAVGPQRHRGAGYDYGSGGYGYGINDVSSSSRQLTAEATAQGMKQHTQNLTTTDQLTADIRRKMTQRYQIEF